MKLFRKLFGKKHTAADKASKIDGIMRKSRFILMGALTILALSSNVVLADCAEDCQSTYDFCVGFCSADPEGDSCRLSCVRSLNSCIRNCTKKSSDSINDMQKDTSADIQKKNKTEESDDSCKWCEPCSPTPGSECLKCCAK